MLTNYYCKCDKCGETRRFDDWPFRDILKAVRLAGWRVTKTGAVWHHYCTECVAKRKEPKPVERPEMWWQRD